MITFLNFYNHAGKKHIFYEVTGVKTVITLSVIIVIILTWHSLCLLTVRAVYKELYVRALWGSKGCKVQVEEEKNTGGMKFLIRKWERVGL